MLIDLCDNRDIGVIKMEVLRNSEPENDFLKKVRDLATNKGIVLIFDECSSGFRETYGGIFKKYDVERKMENMTDWTCRNSDVLVKN